MTDHATRKVTLEWPLHWPTADELVQRSVRIVIATKPDNKMNWVAVRNHFAVGSTVARELCRRSGFDPDTADMVSDISPLNDEARGKWERYSREDLISQLTHFERMAEVKYEECRKLEAHIIKENGIKMRWYRRMNPDGSLFQPEQKSLEAAREVITQYQKRLDDAGMLDFTPARLGEALGVVPGRADAHRTTTADDGEIG